MEFRDKEAYDRWRSLLYERRGEGANQEYLGPKEHGAFAESRVREHPIYGPIEQLALIPGYTLSKLLRARSGRSSASIDEMAEGYRGVGRGMASNAADLADALRQFGTTDLPHP